MFPKHLNVAYLVEPATAGGRVPAYFPFDPGVTGHPQILASIEDCAGVDDSFSAFRVASSAEYRSLHETLWDSVREAPDKEVAVMNETFEPARLLDDIESYDFASEEIVQGEIPRVAAAFPAAAQVDALGERSLHFLTRRDIVAADAEMIGSAADVMEAQGYPDHVGAGGFGECYPAVFEHKRATGVFYSAVEMIAEQSTSPQDWIVLAPTPFTNRTDVAADAIARATQIGADMMRLSQVPTESPAGP